MTTKKKTATKAEPAAKKKTPSKTRAVGRKKTPKKTPKTAPKIKSADVTSDEALRGLPADYADGPDMPVEIAIAEMASLHRLARTVSRQLARVGMGAEQIDTLGRFVARLKSLETGWQRARAGVKLSAGERQKVADGEALKKKLLAGGRWALRKDLAAQGELSRIAEGAGLADTIADLRDLVSFWQDYEEAMKHTDITAKDLTRASALADVLDVTAAKEGNSLDAAAAIDLRNRCFWAADALCVELREAGRYAFRLEPKIAVKFTSRYRTSVKQRTRAKPKADKPATPAPAPIGG